MKDYQKKKDPWRGQEQGGKTMVQKNIRNMGLEDEDA